MKFLTGLSIIVVFFFSSSQRDSGIIPVFETGSGIKEQISREDPFLILPALLPSGPEKTSQVIGRREITGSEEGYPDGVFYLFSGQSRLWCSLTELRNTLCRPYRSFFKVQPSRTRQAAFAGRFSYPPVKSHIKSYSQYFSRADEASSLYYVFRLKRILI